MLQPRALGFLIPRSSVYYSQTWLISDIDECATGADNCDTSAICANTPGSFNCSCDEGYSGDGVTCVGEWLTLSTHIPPIYWPQSDIDECAIDDENCDSDASCDNTPGNFTCNCNHGYFGDGITCMGEWTMQILRVYYWCWYWMPVNSTLTPFSYNYCSCPIFMVWRYREN